jgi:acyl transferase domain-containing protein
VSDIDTVRVESLKALDPNRPLKEAIIVDRGQPVSGREPDDQFAMITHLRAPRNNQASIRSTREIGYSALYHSGVAHAYRVKFHPQLRRSGLNCAQLPAPGSCAHITQDRRPRHTRRDLFE